MNEKFYKDANHLLTKYGYEPTFNGLAKIYNTAHNNKFNVRHILEQHPNWNEDAQAIVFTHDYEREFDRKTIYDFILWVQKKLPDLDIEPPMKPYSAFCAVDDIKSSLADETFVWKINNYMPEVKAVVGQKVSRIVGKMCRILGIDKKFAEEWIETTNPNTGEIVRRNHGYNHQFAKFADAINPLKIKQYTVISVNPLDYWTMSFGRGWASCHTIDKDNLRGLEMNGSHTYEGCYSGGTESYMLDESSVIMYTVSEKWEGEIWKAPKIKRCMFHVALDGHSFVQGRVYPDARDDNDYSYSSQFRAIFQQVLSECVDAPNLWNAPKYERIKDYVDDRGVHYRDYFNYGDCVHSYRKDYEPRIIHIGSNPICPYCGDMHYEERSIMCPCCSDGYKVCEHCGCRITDEDEALYINDEWYCDSNCAVEAGYAYSDYDDEWYIEDEIVIDEYSGETFNRYNDETVYVDEKWFANEYNAVMFGYEYVDGEWVMRNENETEVA